MSTKTRFRASATGLLTILGAAAASNAAVLAPGASSSIGGWTGPTGGTTLLSQTLAFNSGTAWGSLEQTVQELTTGELFFELKVSELHANSGITLTGIRHDGWDGQQVDANFLLGSGASSPGTVSRGVPLGGTSVNWTAFESVLADGGDSALMQVYTKAESYTAQANWITLTFSDGSTASVFGAAPVAVPGPGSLALLGLAGVAGLRRRRS